MNPQQKNKAVEFVSFQLKKKKKKKKKKRKKETNTKLKKRKIIMIMLNFRWKELIDIDKTKLRKSRKCNRLKPLNFAANLGFDMRLNRHITISQISGTFKIYKYLMRTL